MRDPSALRDPSELPLADEPVSHRIVSSDGVFDGAVWNVRRDTFRYGAAEITREYVDHPGAVAILALDENDQVLLVKQYRHPISARDWELPAGLLDVDGESSLAAAKRELAEEVDLDAAEWKLLVEFFSSPGGSSEAIRIYLARGLTARPQAFDRFEEEAEIEKRWVPLDDIVDAVLQRSLLNSIVGIGVLAAVASRAKGWSTLGDPESAWPWHPRIRRAQS